MRSAKDGKFPTSPRKNVANVADEFGMRRSLSSVDGFSSTSMKRTSPARTTMPARIRKEAAKAGQKDMESPTHNGKGKSNANGMQTNGKDSSQAKRANSVGKNNTSSPSMSKGKPLRVPDASPDGRPRTPVTLQKTVRVNGTRASELRAKSRLDGGVADTKSDTDSVSESMKIRTKRYNGKNCKDDESSDTSSEHSMDTVLKLSSPTCHSSMPPTLCSPITYELPSADEFSSKLAEVCNIISEKHPGDFQILETLVTMQTAYEDRDKQVNKVVNALQDRVNELEHKLRSSPNIPSLVVPLLRASNSFQKQLHNIFVNHKDTLSRGGGAAGPLSPNMNGLNGYRGNPFEEIYEEANSVAEHILNRSRSKSSEDSVETAEQILSRSFSRQKSNEVDHSKNNELTNGHVDAIAETILSRSNSLRKSSSSGNSRRNSSEQNGSTGSLSRSNSLRKSNEENVVPKVNGHVNGTDSIHKTEKPDILLNGCGGDLMENGNRFDCFEVERLV